MLDRPINFYFRYINLPYTRKSFPTGLKFVYFCVFLTDLIQAIIFPTLSDMCIYTVFSDTAFVSKITAIHHLGAAIGGLYWFLISYLNLTNVMYNTPLFSSLITYVQLVIYAKYYTYKGKMFHIVWHVTYYTVYSSLNVALTNLIVLSINSMDKGGFIVHYNVLAKIGHVAGPLLNILVTFLPPIKRRFFYFNALPFENLEYVYISISVFCVLRIYASFALRNAQRPNEITSKIKEDYPERNIGTYFRDESVNYSSGRYSHLPWIVFSINILTTLGSGLSISLMGIYMIEKFKIDFMKLWISSLMIPIFTTILLFSWLKKFNGLSVLNSYQKRHGKLVTIFISKVIALLLLYYFVECKKVPIIITLYILRASFQNAPGPLKTSIVLQCSNLKSASYWLSSEYLSRIIMAGMSMLGGHIHTEYGFRSCFVLTALFYLASVLVLVPTIFLFPGV